MIYIDSNALIYLLHDIKPKSDIVVEVLAKNDQVYTSLRTIEEASYILIRINATKHYNVKGIHQVRDLIKKQGLEFVEKELTILRKLLRENNIIVLQDHAEIEDLHKTMIEYRLLPGDAIIALTCRYYGINTILTFDEDFKRIPWLKTIP